MTDPRLNDQGRYVPPRWDGEEPPDATALLREFMGEPATSEPTPLSAELPDLSSEERAHMLAEAHRLVRELGINAPHAARLILEQERALRDGRSIAGLRSGINDELLAQRLAWHEGQTMDPHLVHDYRALIALRDLREVLKGRPVA